MVRLVFMGFGKMGFEDPAAGSEFAVGRRQDTGNQSGGPKFENVRAMDEIVDHEDERPRDRGQI